MGSFTGPPPARTSFQGSPGSEASLSVLRGPGTPSVGGQPAQGSLGMFSPQAEGNEAGGSPEGLEVRVWLGRGSRGAEQVSQAAPRVVARDGPGHLEGRSANPDPCVQGVRGGGRGSWGSRAGSPQELPPISLSTRMTGWVWSPSTQALCTCCYLNYPSRWIRFQVQGGKTFREYSRKLRTQGELAWLGKDDSVFTFSLDLLLSITNTLFVFCHELWPWAGRCPSPPLPPGPVLKS